MMRRLWGHSAVRYLLVGGSSFLVDFGLLWLLHDVARLPVWLASGLAFLASFVYTYSMQRAVAFASRRPHGAGVTRYAILVAVNTLATMAIVTLCNSSTVGWAGGKVIATVVTTVGNYFAYRLWIFPVGHDEKDD